jgi:glycosyltransferase involved in cell wall biosynthesis
MQCPSLAELPEPPRGKTGWPWTEESARLPRANDGSFWPPITIVTPSFNQARFLEEAIRSILLQGYPNLEYFVFDGGSTDGSAEILRKYSQWIGFWVSEPDHGQSAAINRGLQLGSGLFAAWVNSDDMLCKNALTDLLSSRTLATDTIYVGDCIHIDTTGSVLFTHRGRVWSFQDLIRIPSVWRSGGSIDQPAVLFPRTTALEAGGLNPDNHYTMDYELWGNMLLSGIKIQYTALPFGYFRVHRWQKTQQILKQTESLLNTAEDLLARADCLPENLRREWMAELNVYRAAYPKTIWSQSGRLARLGLPPCIVVPVRQLKNRINRRLRRDES